MTFVQILNLLLNNEELFKTVEYISVLYIHLYMCHILYQRA